MLDNSEEGGATIVHVSASERDTVSTATCL